MAEATLAACAHCGLPSAGAAYCCFGCELAARIQAEARDDHGHLFGTLAFTLVLSMVVLMLALFLYAEDVFGAGDVEMAWLRSIYRWASLVLATPVMALAGVPLAKRALGAGRLSMDALIALGAFAAYGLSVANLAARQHGLYFDSAATAVVLATFGRYLEAKARSRASQALGPLVEVARGLFSVRAADGRWRELSGAQIAPGDLVRVSAERVVPVDLALESERAEVDLAVLSGESRPVVVSRGELVPAGAVAVGAGLEGRALRAARDSALERLAELARGLHERASPTLAWADRFAAALTPIVALVALATLAWWTRAGSFGAGVVAALAVVLAACPCSYAIAAPLVRWLMLRRAFLRGVLIRRADALEALARVRAVAFDKTGTLTQPLVQVTAVELHAPREEVAATVRALEQSSTHPIAHALLAWAGAGGPAQLTAQRLVAGRGAFGTDAQGRALSLSSAPGGDVALVRDGETLARFSIADALRPEAAEAVSALRAAGLRLVLLSGDDAARVEPVARALDLEWHARLAPAEKVARLESLGPRAAMVGDGVNDAPALAGLAAGFTFSGAAPLAKGVAQVTLLEPDLRLVPFTLALARRGLRLTQWLIGASTAYNVIFVALAAAGALRPVWAGLSMLVSSLIAIFFAASIGARERA